MEEFTFSFFFKLQASVVGPQVCNFIKKRLRHRTPILKNVCDERLFPQSEDSLKKCMWYDKNIKMTFKALALQSLC